MTDDVKVTQADRDALAEYYREGGAHRLFCGRIVAGDVDSDPHMQAFARHRHTSTGALRSQVADLQAKLGEAEKALRFYGNEAVAYSFTQAEEPRCAVLGDRGRLAREALSKISEAKT